MEEHKEKEEYVCLATYMGAVTDFGTAASTHLHRVLTNAVINAG